MPENSNYDDANDLAPPSDAEFLPPEGDASPPPAERNDGRQWIIPVAVLGCGCICLPLIVIAVGFLGAGNFARRLWQSTGTYQVYHLATDELESEAAVIEALGAPIEAGWASQSKEEYDSDGIGEVCMRFTVTGSDRSGSAYTEAQNIEGEWLLHQLVLSVNGEPDPLPVIPLDGEEVPLCPEFDDPDANDFETPEEDILPGAGSEV